MVARKKGRLRLPILRSKEPGTLHLTNEQIYEIILFPDWKSAGK